MSKGSDWLAGAEFIKARDARYAKFFIPGAADDVEAERVLTSIAKHVSRPVPPTEERLRRVAYKHNEEYFVAEVGQPIDPYYCTEGPVIAIFQGNPVLICTRARGVLRGEPIYVSKDDILSTRYFGEMAQN